MFRLVEEHRHSVALAVILAVWAAVLGFYLLQEHEYTGQVAGVPLDDSWIHFRYAENLAEGYGLSFNPGELSAGSTSPLWAMALALASFFTGEFLITSKILGALCFLGTALLVQHMALNYTSSEKMALVAALITLLAGRLAWTSLSGMETGAFTFASMIAISRWKIRLRRLSNALLLGLLFGLVTLLRPEGWGLFGLAAAIQLAYLVKASPPLSLASRVRVLVAQVLAYACIALAYVIFCLLVTGNPLPNTFYAKTGAAERVSILQYGVWISFLFAIDNPVALAACVAGTFTLLPRLVRSEGRPRLGDSTLPLAWLLLLPLANGLMAPYTTVYYFRYLVPLIPIVALFCAVGLQTMLRFVDELARPRLTKRLLSLVIGITILAGLPGLVNWADFFGRSVSDIQGLHVAVGRWLAEHTDPGEEVATHDVGAIACLSNRHIIDLAGLISPSILPAVRGRGPGTRDEAVFEKLESRRPDYVVVLEGWFPTWSKKASLVPIHSVSLDDNAIATSDTFIVYRCDWRSASARTP